MCVVHADITVNYSQHFLYSILDIDNNLRLILGKGFLFLQNISGKYMFLPTSYYTNSLDVGYGILASIIWFIALFLLSKLIFVFIRPQQSNNVKNLKILLVYFVVLFIWMVFSLGLFKPSSFLITPALRTPGSPTPQQPSPSNLFSLQNASITSVYVIPFGLGIIILAIGIFDLKIIKNRFVKKEKKKEN